MEPEEFQFMLTADDFNAIISALADKPWRQVNATLVKLDSQMKNQQQEKPPE